MSVEDIRNRFGVPVKLYQTVRVNGRQGTVVSTKNGYINVRFNGDFGRPTPCHPTWRVEYYVLGSWGMEWRGFGIGEPAGNTGDD